MSLSNSMKWYSGAVSSSLSPLIPMVGDAMAYASAKVKGPFGKGATRLLPFGQALGAAQILYLGYTNRAAIARESGHAGSRTLEVLSGGRYQAPDSAWQNTPSDRFSSRRKHGFLVSPSDRMRRNPSMMSSHEVARRDFQRYT